MGLRQQFNVRRLRARVGRLRFKLTVAAMGDRASATRGILAARSSLVVGSNGRLHLGDKAKIGPDSSIEARGVIEAGSRLSLGPMSRIVAHDRITLGNNVLVAQMVSILDHDHALSVRDGQLAIATTEYVTAPVTIGSNVWIGDKVTILKGVNIADGVVIAANSVVTADVPPLVLVAGAPARVVRHLDENDELEQP